MPIARNRTLTDDDLWTITELLNLDGDAVRKNYSGRGMYGATCVGFVVDRSEIVAVGAALTYVMAQNVDPDDLDDTLEDALDLAKRAVIDSMGTQAIVYFPGVTAATGTPS